MTRKVTEDEAIAAAEEHIIAFHLRVPSHERLVQSMGIVTNRSENAFAVAAAVTPDPPLPSADTAAATVPPVAAPTPPTPTEGA